MEPWEDELLWDCLLYTSVVSKCALWEKKEEGPRFPGDLPADSIVLRQLLYQIIPQHLQDVYKRQDPLQAGVYGAYGEFPFPQAVL